MIVSNHKNFIFIHVPKSAGSSITQTIEKYNDISSSDVFSQLTLKHETARFIKQVDKGRFDTYLTFCFVRNPWDRLVSWYFYENSHQLGFSYIFPRFDDFIFYLDQAWEFINLQWDYKIYKVMNDPYVIPLPQTDFVLDVDNHLIVDYVGRFEDINTDFSRLMKIIGSNAELPHQNRTIHKNYIEYYSKKSREIVEKRFQKEISFWGYHFDNEEKPVLHCSPRYLQLEEGHRKVEQRNYEEAVSLYQQMQKDPLSNLLVNKKLAELYYCWGRYQECMDYGLEIVEHCNEDIEGWKFIMKSASKLNNRLIFNQAFARVKIYNELRQSSKVSVKQIIKSIFMRKDV